MLLLPLLLSSAGGITFYCDSTLHQRCPDGSLCSSSTADCQTLGPRQCICQTKTSAGNEWCDSVVGNQRCSDGTICSVHVLECVNPRHCRCGSKTTSDKSEFCDSTAQNQRCKDGTPCDAHSLDCPTLQKCICGSRGRVLTSSSSMVSAALEFCDSTLLGQKCIVK